MCSQGSSVPRIAPRCYCLLRHVAHRRISCAHSAACAARGCRRPGDTQRHDVFAVPLTPIASAPAPPVASILMASPKASFLAGLPNEGSCTRHPTVTLSIADASGIRNPMATLSVRVRGCAGGSCASPKVRRSLWLMRQSRSMMLVLA